MSLFGFYVDQLVHWQDPLTPKQGRVSARILDIAGSWLLIRNETGTQKGKLAWVDHHLVKAFERPTDILALLREIERVKRIEHGRKDASQKIAEQHGWPGACTACFGHLQDVHRQEGRKFQVTPHWLYCPTCDRMQRHQETGVESRRVRRKKIAVEPDDATPGGTSHA